MATGSFDQHDRSFVEECALAHSTFTTDSSVTKIILKSEMDGYLLCKKIFGTELYFRQRTGPASERTRAGAIVSNDMPVEHLEPLVRDRLRAWHKLNLL